MKIIYIIKRSMSCFSNSPLSHDHLIFTVLYLQFDVIVFCAGSA